jgi:hypothetical protein
MLVMVSVYAYSTANKQPAPAQKAQECPQPDKPTCPDVAGLFQYQITGTPRNPASTGLMKTFASLSTATQRLLCAVLKESIKLDKHKDLPLVKASQGMATVSRLVEAAREGASKITPLADNQALTAIVINTYESLMMQVLTAIAKPEYTTAEQQQAAYKDIILDITDMLCPFSDLGFPLSRNGAAK